ncbi:MAG: glycosyltransferase [Methanobrevibacter sp.]|nr:glycosyltransferase [Methanobrevibacter sp.]
MNILHVVPSFAPCFSAGGVVNSSYKIAKKQAENGHNVVVYTTDSCKNRLKFENNYNVNVDGINVFYFKNISNNVKNKLTIDTPLGLNSNLKNNIDNFDIVHIHEHRHSLAILTHKYAKKNNIPYVLHAHGSVLPFFQKEKLKEIFDKLWGFDILYDAHKLIAETEVEKAQYIDMGVKEELIEIVPTGVELDDFNFLPQKGNFKSKYGISPDEKLILFLGRINKIKGLDLLIKAFNRIDNDNVKLAIVGGDYGFKQELNQLISEFNLKDKVIFPGVLIDDAKKEALIDCDLFVIPSRYESFGVSTLEAMACEKPIVMTKNNHIHNWIEGNAGLTCEFNENQLAGCIEKLLNDEELSKRFGKTGKKLIIEKYNWDKIEKEMEKVYQSCIC